MTMVEVEQSIRNDMEILGDNLNRMEYLLGCARVDPGIPETERSNEFLVADCQVNTWLEVRWEDDILHLRTDSESFLVKGALSLITEIYNGRTRPETAEFTCTLLSYKGLSALLNRDQKKGLENVLSTLKGGVFS